MCAFNILSIPNLLICCILIVPNMSSENPILDQAAPGPVKVWSGTCFFLLNDLNGSGDFVLDQRFWVESTSHETWQYQIWLMAYESQSVLVVVDIWSNESFSHRCMVAARFV